MSVAHSLLVLMNIDLVRKVIKTEQQKSSNAWLELSEIAQICKARYGLVVSRELFINNPAFRVYRTSNLSEMYITLAETMDALYLSTIKFPNSITLESKSTSSKPAIAKPKLQQQAIPLKPLKRVSSINLCEDLEQALLGILRDLGATLPHHFIEITTLTKHFYEVYGQPIKPVLNALIPGLKLIEFLQCSDLFALREVDGKWSVTSK